MFDGVNEALRVPDTEPHLFGMPESFTKRPMGVALAFNADADAEVEVEVEVAKTRAKLATSNVTPRVA